MCFFPFSKVPHTLMDPHPAAKGWNVQPIDPYSVSASTSSPVIFLLPFRPNCRRRRLRSCCSVFLPFHLSYPSTAHVSLVLPSKLLQRFLPHFPLACGHEIWDERRTGARGVWLEPCGRAVGWLTGALSKWIGAAGRGGWDRTRGWGTALKSFQSRPA